MYNERAFSVKTSGDSYPRNKVNILLHPPKKNQQEKHLLLQPQQASEKYNFKENTRKKSDFVDIFRDFVKVFCFYLFSVVAPLHNCLSLLISIYIHPRFCSPTSVYEHFRNATVDVDLDHDNVV